MVEDYDGKKMKAPQIPIKTPTTTLLRLMLMILFVRMLVWVRRKLVLVLKRMARREKGRRKMKQLL